MPEAAGWGYCEGIFSTNIKIKPHLSLEQPLIGFTKHFFPKSQLCIKNVTAEIVSKFINI